MDDKPEIDDATREMIRKHNARTADFWKRHGKRIDDLTDDECRRLYARWTDPTVDIAANRLALEFREELGMTWPKKYAVGIGMRLVYAMLVRLDKYDPDFRPRPEPQEICEIGDGKLWYLPAVGRFRVELGKASEEFRALHRPTYGVDGSDMAHAEEIYSRLQTECVELAR